MHTEPSEEPGRARRVPAILLADDIESVRKGLRARLGDGYDWQVCGEAANGREAVAKVAELHPDLVILDLSMPVMNGLEAAREIRRIAPATKIIIFSMHSSEGLAGEAVKAGADTYIPKASSFGELERTIATLLEGHPAGSKPRG